MYHHSDEIADLSDAMRDAQEWQDIAGELYALLNDILFEDRDGTGVSCAFCYGFSHTSSCEAKAILDKYEKKAGFLAIERNF